MRPSSERRRKTGRFINARLSAWLVASTLLAVSCFTDFFLRYVSNVRSRGPGYSIYIALFFFLIIFVLYRTFRNLDQLTGGRRIELQVWLIGGCAMTLSILTTMVAQRGDRENRSIFILQPLFVLAFYAGTVYAITIHRILDAHQILRVCLNKLVLIAGVAGVAYSTFLFLCRFLSSGMALLPTIMIALVGSSLLKNWLDRRFEFYPQDSAARQAAYTVAHNETRSENLEMAFLDILRGWGRADQALIITGAGGKSGGSNEDLTEDEQVANAMRQLHWVTPERLARRKADRCYYMT